MVIMKMALPRRTFLRGTGAVLALPFLDAMVPALGAAPKSAPRIGFFQTPNGMSMPYWTPKTVGSNFEFTQPLASLAPFRNQTIVLSGLNHYSAGLGDGGGPHTRNNAAWLTGKLAIRTETNPTLGISADQVAARVLGKETMLDSLELSTTGRVVRSGSCENGYSCLYQLMSWRSETQPNPTESNPRVLFERMFGEETTADARAARIKADKSILDAVVGQVKKLETKLNVSDRSTVSEYLDTVREVEQRIQKAEKQNTNSEFSTGERPSGIPDKWPEHRELIFDLLFLAYQADITRVATYQCGDAGVGGYAFVGVPEEHHETSHHQNNPEKRAKLAKIDAYNVSTFAKLVEKMSKTRDGDGTLLDRAFLMFGSSISDGDLHSPLDLPTVLVGGGNGTLKGNQHLKFAEDKKTPMTNLLLTILDKAGVHTQRLGDSTGDLTEL